MALTHLCPPPEQRQRTPPSLRGRWWSAWSGKWRSTRAWCPPASPWPGGPAPTSRRRAEGSPPQPPQPPAAGGRQVGGHRRPAAGRLGRCRTWPAATRPKSFWGCSMPHCQHLVAVQPETIFVCLRSAADPPMCLKHNMGGTQMSFFVFFPIFAKFVFCVVFFAILLSMFFFSPGIWIWPSKKSDSGPHFSLGQTLVDFCCFWILPYKKI